MNELQERYLNWIADLISVDNLIFIKRLYDIDYSYIKAMDGNRWIDGCDLRYRFGYENDISDNEICKGLDNRPCSFLEMTVALALRLEENIMYSPVEGSRIGLWFDTMMKSLDILEGDSLHQLKSKIGAFEIGRIPLFKGSCTDDDVWYQAVKYLDRNYRKPLLEDMEPV